MQHVKQRGDMHSNTIADEFRQKVAREHRREQITRLTPSLVLLVLIIIASITVEGFFTSKNRTTLLTQLAIPLVLATGLTNVIIIGGINLALEGMMGFAGSIVTLLILNNKNQMDLGIWGILLTIAVGCLVGIIIGVMHVKLRMPSFILTYGFGSILAGFAVMSYRGQPAVVQYQLFEQISRGSFLGIPYLTLLALFIFLIGCFLERYTAFARSVYAIGDNESIVRANGINVNRVKIKVFAWCSLCASVAGVFGAMRLNRGEVSIGYNNLFTTITALVVGGTSLAGGKGGMLQSLLGVCIVTVLDNVLILMSVEPVALEALKGIIIIVVVALSIQRGTKVFQK